MEVDYGDPMLCCGLRELAGVSLDGEDNALDDDLPNRLDPKEAIKTIKEKMKDFTTGKGGWAYTTKGVRPAHIVFSDAYMPHDDDDDYYKASGGHKMAAYIRLHKLGKVRASAKAHNRNSGNDVKAWLWTPDWKAIEKHEVAK